MSPMLAVKNLRVSRSNQILFDQLSFELHSGELLLVEGKNGSGKSSLLRTLCGLSFPCKGEIRFNGERIEKNASLYRDHLHYLGHLNGIKLGLTVLETLQIFLYLNPSKPHDSPHRVAERLNLSPYLHKNASQLSAGEKRRLGLAKLFLIPKPIWIVDEPCTALDNQSQHIFYTHLDFHLSKGGIALISSHEHLSIQTRMIKKVRLGHD